MDEESLVMLIGLASYPALILLLWFGSKAFYALLSRISKTIDKDSNDS